MVRLRYEAKISLSYLLEGLKSLLSVCQRAREPPEKTRPSASSQDTFYTSQTEKTAHSRGFFFFPSSILAHTWLEQHR